MTGLLPFTTGIHIQPGPVMDLAKQPMPGHHWARLRWQLPNPRAIRRPPVWWARLSGLTCFEKEAPFPLRNIEIRILSNSSTALEMTHNSRLAEPFDAFPTLVLPRIGSKNPGNPKSDHWFNSIQSIHIWIILRFPQTTAFPIDHHEPFGWFWGSCWETSIAPTWPSSRPPNDQHHIWFPRFAAPKLPAWHEALPRPPQVAKLGGIRSETLALYLSKSEQNGPNNWMFFVYLCYKYYCFTIWDC